VQITRGKRWEKCGFGDCAPLFARSNKSIRNALASAHHHPQFLGHTVRVARLRCKRDQSGAAGLPKWDRPEERTSSNHLNPKISVVARMKVRLAHPDKAQHISVCLCRLNAVSRDLKGSTRTHQLHLRFHLSITHLHNNCAKTVFVLPCWSSKWLRVLSFPIGKYNSFWLRGVHGESEKEGCSECHIDLTLDRALGHKHAHMRCAW
jgi:hypothetical protein